MLTYLRISNFNIISDLEVEFADGFNVITGETGAGKTLLVSAILALFSEKNAFSLGAPKTTGATIEAQLFLANGDEVVLKRVFQEGSKSRSFINGELVSFEELKSLVSPLIDINGQLNFARLKSPSFGLKLLDDYGNIDGTQIDELNKKIKRLKKELEGIYLLKSSGALNEVENEIDAIERAAIKGPTELEELEQKERELQEIKENFATLIDLKNLLNEVDEKLHMVLKSLNRLDSLGDFKIRVERSQIELSDIASEISNMLRSSEVDENLLEETRQRRYELSQLRRRFSRDLGEILSHLEELKSKKEALEKAKDKEEEILKELAFLSNNLKVLEQERLNLRKAKAKEFEKEVASYLGVLGLKGAQFKLDKEADFKFMFSYSKDVPLKELAKVASGGELSRVMLAISMLAKEPGKIFIFDEIDTGVGGETGIAVGKALYNLSKSNQVIAVTHLAQVAAFGDKHYLFLKDEKAGIRAKTLDDESRVMEIARMLAGVKTSKNALYHARELLEFKKNLD